MTGLGVERMRTAFPLPFRSPAGVSALMPPHIQGAERPTESRARRTRWGLRVLVIGGLAGAAWLLTSVAAHAADRTDGPTGSLLGSVVGADDASPVSGLLQAAAQPLESIAPVHRHDVVASVAPSTHAPAAAQDENPGGNGPAEPLQMHLEDVSGTPTTSGSGTPPEDGAPAFRPAAIADSTSASHLLPIASDVEVPRHDAEAPTVSPD